MRSPPRDKVAIIKPTVSIMLEIPPLVKRALTDESLVFATKPFIIKLVKSVIDWCGF